MGMKKTRKHIDHVRPLDRYAKKSNVRVFLAQAHSQLSAQDIVHMENTIRREEALMREEAEKEARQKSAEKLFVSVRRRLEFEHYDEPARLDVPRLSSRIQSLFIPSAHRDAALGDREEIFRRDVSKHGRAWAVWLYRWDTFVAMCSWMKKMVSFSAIAGLGGAVLKWLGAGS